MQIMVISTAKNLNSCSLLRFFRFSMTDNISFLKWNFLIIIAIILILRYDGEHISETLSHRIFDHHITYSRCREHLCFSPKDVGMWRALEKSTMMKKTYKRTNTINLICSSKMIYWHLPYQNSDCFFVKRKVNKENRVLSILSYH